MLSRIFAIPAALIAFAALYTLSIKTPHMVEDVSLLLWLALPFAGISIFILKLVKKS